MTTFQLTTLGFFVGALLFNYGAQLKAFLASVKTAKPTATTVAVKPKAAYTVQDLTTVAELRDRLAAIGCDEGVEACKTLIRVMIEFKLP